MKIIIFGLLVWFLLPGLILGQCDCSQQGDMDGIDGIDIGDLVYFVEYQFLGGPAPPVDPFCLSFNRGDLNCDLEVDIADLVNFVDYQFFNDWPPCDYCLFFEGNDQDLTISEDYLIFLDTNYYNEIYDSSSSAFAYINNPGPVYDVLTEMIDDTMITSAQGYLDHNDGLFYQFIPGPPMSSSPGVSGEIIFEQDKNPATVTRARLPTSSYRLNGTSGTRYPIRLNGNTVSVNGYSHNFAQTFPLSTTLVNSAYQCYLNPPSHLTAQQINEACSEGCISIANARIFSVSESKSYKWTAGGFSYLRVETYSFSFQNYYEWECWDGPETHNHYSSFNISIRITRNGTLISSTIVQAVHFHRFP